MTPFEALYGRRCRSPIGLFKIGDVRLVGLDLAPNAMDKVRLIRERFLAAQSRHKT